MSKKGKKTQIVGYRYFIDFLMGICRGSVDSLVAIRAGDLPAWTGEESNNNTFNINVPNLFGGDAGEGGLVGNVTVMMGGDDQVIDEGIKDSISGGNLSSNEGNWTFVDGIGTSDEGATSEFRGDISDFIGVTTIWWSGQIASNNPYPKAWKARTRRAIKGWGPDGCWYPAKAIISYAPQIATGTVGAWDASANNPTLASGVGFSGQTFNVSVAGDTNLDGNHDWQIGQMASFDGGTSKWEKITSGETIIKAMNPAHILYQCITNRSWGRGMAREELDDAAWTYAANYLFNESFGLCIRWSKDGDINDFIQTIIDHIGAALYIDRGTGLLVLRLIRNDYDYAKLPIFDYSSGLLSVDTQETGATTVLANEVVVTWRDPIRDQARQTRVHNLASMQSLGYPISMKRDFPGIADPDLAQRVALRELQVSSAGVKRLKLRFDRRAWRIQPGMVMRIAAPDKGIADMVVRVATYDDGTMLDGTITMDVLQDVFGLPTTIYTTPADNPTTEPVRGTAPPVVFEMAQEATYLDMLRGLSSADFAAVGDTEGGVIAMAGRPNATSQYYAMFATPAGGATERDPGIYAPVAVSGRPLDFYDINIFVSNGVELDSLAVGMTGVLGGVELVKVTGFTPSTGTIVVARGGGDTVPVRHVGGEAVFFNDVAASAFTVAYETGDVLSVQLQNITSTAVSDLALAGTMTVPIVGRHFMPFVMGNLRLNTHPALSASAVGVTGNAVFTWASRNRILQSDQFIAHGDGAVAAESGTTYTVEVWDTVANTMIRAHSGLTASTYTYDAAEKASGAPDPIKLTFVFYTVRDGSVRSYNLYRIPVFYVAPGEMVGQAAGVGAANGVGSYFLTRSVGTAAGTSTAHAAGIGLGTVTSVGHAAGVGSVIWGLRGQAAGVGSAAAVGVMIGLPTGVGHASGVGAADAASASFGIITGRSNASGHADASGVGVYTVSAVGSASGVGAANAPGTRVGINSGVGAAHGTGAASGTSSQFPTLDGFGSGIHTGGTTVSAVVTTTQTNDIVVFAVYAEIADGTATPPTYTISNSGTALTWTLRSRRSQKSPVGNYNNAATLDVWIARSPTILHHITVTATSNVAFDNAACLWFGVQGVASFNSPFDPHPILPVLNNFDDNDHGTPTGRFSTSKGNANGDFIFTIIASSTINPSVGAPGVGAEGQTHIVTVQEDGGTLYASMTALYRRDTARNYNQPFGITNTVYDWIGVIDAFTADIGNAGGALGRGTANGVGRTLTISAGVGSASGHGTASGVGMFGETGHAAGVGAASGVGSHFFTGVGSADGTGAASGAGSMIAIVSGVGAAAGTGDVTGIPVVPDFTFMIVGVGVVSP